jgi:hypothetical protein
MLSPSEVIGWECGACAYTNEDATCHNCLVCQTRHPVRYAIVAGATAAMTARTTRVDHCKQARFAALATAGGLLLPGRRLPLPMGPSQGRRLMLPMGHLLSRLGIPIFGSDFWAPHRRWNSDSVYDSEDSGQIFFLKFRFLESQKIRIPICNFWNSGNFLHRNSVDLFVANLN